MMLVFQMIPNILYLSTALDYIYYIIHDVHERPAKVQRMCTNFPTLQFHDFNRYPVFLFVLILSDSVWHMIM